jgi:hypothetical protein
MSDAIITDAPATDTVEARHALTLAYVDAANDLAKIHKQCQAAYSYLALKGDANQTDYLKAWAKDIALEAANRLYPSDPEMALKMSQTDGRKPGATAVSHTALLQRAKAWEYALYQSTAPTEAVVAATFRLASASGPAKAAREEFEKSMKDGKGLSVSEEDFAKAALSAAGSVPAPTGNVGGTNGNKEVEFDITTALAALTWLSNNSKAIEGEDRTRVLASAKALIALYK